MTVCSLRASAVFPDIFNFPSKNACSKCKIDRTIVCVCVCVCVQSCMCVRASKCVCLTFCAPSFPLTRSIKSESFIERVQFPFRPVHQHKHSALVHVVCVCVCVCDGISQISRHSGNSNTESIRECHGLPECTRPSLPPAEGLGTRLVMVYTCSLGDTAWMGLQVHQPFTDLPIRALDLEQKAPLYLLHHRRPLLHRPLLLQFPRSRDYCV